MSWQVRTAEGRQGFVLYNTANKRFLDRLEDATAVTSWAAKLFESPKEAKKFRHVNKLAKAGKPAPFDEG